MLKRKEKVIDREDEEKCIDSVIFYIGWNVDSCLSSLDPLKMLVEFCRVQPESMRCFFRICASIIK